MKNHSPLKGEIPFGGFVFIGLNVIFATEF